MYLHIFTKMFESLLRSDIIYIKFSHRIAATKKGQLTYFKEQKILRIS